MDQKETGTIDSLTVHDTSMGMDFENIFTGKNPCLLEVWNDFIETNKRWYQLKEKELKANCILGKKKP